MRHATTSTLTAAIALVALSACSGSADTGSPDPSPSSSTPVPTPTDTAPPAPPVMPPTAKAHTKAGAKAFVEYFWQVADYAQMSLDPEQVRGLVSRGCEPCKAAIGFVEKVRAKNGKIQGGNTTVGDFDITLDTVGRARLALVAFQVTNTDQVVDYPGSAADEHYPAAKVRDRFTLGFTDGGWQVVGWQVLK